MSVVEGPCGLSPRPFQLLVEIVTPSSPVASHKGQIRTPMPLSAPAQSGSDGTEVAENSLWGGRVLASPEERRACGGETEPGCPAVQNPSSGNKPSFWVGREEYLGP